MLIVLLSPQLILLLGNAVATKDVVDYLTKTTVSQLPPIVASSAHRRDHDEQRLRGDRVPDLDAPGPRAP